MRYFPAAAMSKTLKITSLFGSLLIVFITYKFLNEMPPVSAGRLAHGLGLVIAVLLPSIVVFSLCFMVRGYSLSHTHLLIHRLFWSTKIHLVGTLAVEFEPEKLKGSIRVFGNGGLFSFTGLYKNKTLGLYRLFATDFDCAVILFLANKTFVITPAEPQEFMDYAHSLLINIKKPVRS